MNGPKIKFFVDGDFTNLQTRKCHKKGSRGTGTVATKFSRHN